MTTSSNPPPHVHSMRASAVSHGSHEMKVERALWITGKIGLIAAVALAIVGLAFRSFVWASWPPSGDDPYGASDILELLIFFLVVASSGICVLCGIGLLFFQP